MNYSNFSKTQTELSEALKNPEPEEIVTTNEVIEPEVTSVIEEPKPEFVIGTVANCKKLNIRQRPNPNAEIMAVVDEGKELMVNVTANFEEWYAVCTASGVEGYCMKRFVTIEQ